MAKKLSKLQMAQQKAEAAAKKTNQRINELGGHTSALYTSLTTIQSLFDRIRNVPEENMLKYEKLKAIRVNWKQQAEKIELEYQKAEVKAAGQGAAGVGAGVAVVALGPTAAMGIATTFGVASTGTAISALSGAAATNAALAWLGGGALAAGGGGMAAGAAALSAATLGVGLLVGGIIFSVTGSKLSGKADEAWAQMKKAEEKINVICNYLVDLRTTSNKYYETLSKVNSIYQRHLDELKCIVNVREHTNWNTFTSDEKILTENTVLLVGLLYSMCKVELVLKGKNENDINTINKTEIDNSIKKANAVLTDKF